MFSAECVTIGFYTVIGRNEDGRNMPRILRGFFGDISFESIRSTFRSRFVFFHRRVVCTRIDKLRRVLWWIDKSLRLHIRYISFSRIGSQRLSERSGLLSSSVQSAAQLSLSFVSRFSCFSTSFRSLQTSFSDFSSSTISNWPVPGQGEESRSLRSVQKVSFLQSVGGRQREIGETDRQGGHVGQQGFFGGTDLRDAHESQDGGGHDRHRTQWHLGLVGDRENGQQGRALEHLTVIFGNLRSLGGHAHSGLDGHSQEHPGVARTSTWTGGGQLQPRGIGWHMQWFTSHWQQLRFFKMDLNAGEQQDLQFVDDVWCDEAWEYRHCGGQQDETVDEQSALEELQRADG